jgi:hypothetical protein
MRMPKRLHNIGPTFCGMTKAVLKDQVGRNIFLYVDVIVVVKKESYIIAHPIETFANMHEAKLKLNPEKCVFRVTRNKVLGCLVSTKGKESSPYKIKAILQMKPPQTRKEVQKLIGRIAALNIFIAKRAERSCPFSACCKASQKLNGG